MKKARASSSAGSVGKQTQGSIAHPAPTAQVRRAIAPPLGAVSGDAISRILTLTALHIRKTLPAISDLTLDALELALVDLRPPFEEILDHLLDSAGEED